MVLLVVHLVAVAARPAGRRAGRYGLVSANDAEY
jgi:hypothetical protein